MMELEVRQQSVNDIGTHATLACLGCRKHKRKCDKQLPVCGLCQRVGRSCDYSDDTRGTLPSSEDFAALRQEVSDLRALLSNVVTRTPESLSIGSGASNQSKTNDSQVGSTGSADGQSDHAAHQSQWSPTSSWMPPSSFPAIFFLDSDAFEYDRFQIQTPYLRVPPDVLALLGSSAELRTMIEEYFVTVHFYFPMVSKIRLYQHLANPLHEPGADIALLFLAMKLSLSTVPDREPSQSQLYQDVKSFYSFVESQSRLSIHSIQALLLIALYELGNAIYPAAYLSIGNAARLGYAMGLHTRNVPSMLSRPITWTEQEERRRVWWAVIILDRFVSAGNTGKPFAACDPTLDTHLPTDDASWDRGHMLVSAPLALSASQTVDASPFARLCQAAHLLGKVIHHKNDKNIPIAFRFDEALQLHRTLRALAIALSQGFDAEDSTPRPTPCSSMALVSSALLLLYDMYSCTEKAIPDAPESQLQMQKVAIDGMREVSEAALAMARRTHKNTNKIGSLMGLSPFVLDALYQAAATYAWYVRETSDPVHKAQVAELKELLAVFGARWRVAYEYLHLVEAMEYNLANVVR